MEDKGVGGEMDSTSQEAGLQNDGRSEELAVRVGSHDDAATASPPEYLELVDGGTTPRTLKSLLSKTAGSKKSAVGAGRKKQGRKRKDLDENMDEDVDLTPKSIERATRSTIPKSWRIETTTSTALEARWPCW